MNAGNARGKRNAWAALLLGYLTLTLPILAVGVSISGGWWLAAGHVAALAWVAAVRAEAGRDRLSVTLSAWTLPVLLPFLYAELPTLMEAMPGVVAYHDAAVQAFEEAVLGGRPDLEWAAALPSRLVSETLHLGYLLYYPLIYVPPLLLWLGVTGPPGPPRRREAFHETVLAIGLAMLGAYAVMVVWPVQGPRYLGVPPGVPPGPIRSVVLAILEGGSSRGAAFPSSHASLATAQCLLALRWQRPVGIVCTAVAVLLMAGAVYGGFHYLSDVVAGALLGGTAAGVAVTVGRGAGKGTSRGDTGRMGASVPSPVVDGY